MGKNPHPSVCEPPPTVQRKTMRRTFHRARRLQHRSLPGRWRLGTLQYVGYMHCNMRRWNAFEAKVMHSTSCRARWQRMRRTSQREETMQHTSLPHRRSVHGMVSIQRVYSELRRGSGHQGTRMHQPQTTVRGTRLRWSNQGYPEVRHPTLSHRWWILELHPMAQMLQELRRRNPDPNPNLH